MRKNGELFGTLCAIDSRPAELKNPKIINMFSLFAELLSFHLHSIELMERNQWALKETNRKLDFSTEEVRQYQHISSHNLKEPLRKIMLFSDRLLHNSDEEVSPSAKVYVQKIGNFAKELGQKIDNVRELASLTAADGEFSQVDLTQVIREVEERLRRTVKQSYNLTVDPLPVIFAVSHHMTRLFYDLLDNSIRFTKPHSIPTIHVSTQTLTDTHVTILVADEGIGIESFRLRNIFNLFEHSDSRDISEGLGTGLTICRRIVHEHGGQIDASSDPAAGTVFRITLPIRRYSLDGAFADSIPDVSKELS